MCGSEVTSKPRGGALAALMRPTSPSKFVSQADLVFHSPTSPRSITATHMRLTPTGDGVSDDGPQDYAVVIHKTGDLLREIEECGKFYEFPLQSVSITNRSGARTVDIALATPVSLEVGNEGIIGRRVSLFSTSPTASRRLVAEGIIGFNM